MDWAGLVTFSSGLFLLVLALIRGNDAGWGSTQIVVELVAAGVLLLLFVVVEMRQKRPMLDITLFRKPTFSGAVIAAFAVSASLFASFLYLTLYFQNVLGYTPVQTGLRFLPLTVVAFFIAPLAGRLSGRFPARALMGTGLALVAVALLLMHGITVGSTWTELLAGFVVAGVGLGILNPILAQTAVGVVPPPAAAWPRESTTPAARWVWPPGSPPSGRCSSTRCSPRPANWWPARRRHSSWRDTAQRWLSSWPRAAACPDRHRRPSGSSS